MATTTYDSKYLRVCELVENDLEPFEQTINKWLERGDHDIVDIKYGMVGDRSHGLIIYYLKK